MRKTNKVANYEEYRKIQITRSDAKWASVTFNEKQFYKALLTALPKMYVSATGKCLKPERIVCMGIRNGNEYLSFKKIQKTLTEIEGAHLYGVDINPKVTDVGPNCFGFDFSHLPEDWAYRFDFLYSNSLDHSFDITQTISEWHRVLKHDRFMLLQLSDSERVCKTDIYAFEESDVEKLFDKKRFEIRHVWKEYGQEDFFNALIRIIK